MSKGSRYTGTLQATEVNSCAFEDNVLELSLEMEVNCRLHPREALLIFNLVSEGCYRKTVNDTPTEMFHRDFFPLSFKTKASYNPLNFVLSLPFNTHPRSAVILQGISRQ